MEKTKLIRMSWFAYFVFLSTWAVLSYLSFERIWTSRELFAQADQKGSNVQVSDFTTFYAAGEIAREALFGRAALYDPDRLRGKINELIAPIHMPDNLAMQYPPPYLLLLAALPVLPLPISWIAWSVLSGLALALAIVFFASPPGATRAEKAIACAYGLAWFPTFWCCWLGQNSQLLFLFVAAVFFLLRKEKYTAAGLTTAIGILKIQYLPVVAVIGLVLGKWRFAVGALLGYALLLAISVGLFGPSNVFSFFGAVLGQEGNTAGTVAHMMDCARGLLSLFLAGILGDKMVLILSTVVLVLGMVLTAWLWMVIYPKLMKKDLPAFEVCLAFSVITMLVTSLHCHTQDYVLLLLAGINIFLANRKLAIAQSDRASRTLKVCINVILFAVLPLASWFYAIKFLFMICYIVKPLLLVSLLLAALEAILVKRSISEVSPGRVRAEA